MRTAAVLSVLSCLPLAAAPALPIPPAAPVLGTDRWERIALDSAAKRLYIPGSAEVLVLDLDGRAQGQVVGLQGPQAVALAPELGIGFTCNPRASTVSIFNLATLGVEKELRTTGSRPGVILFEPATRRIFTFNLGGRNATAFDAFGGAVAGSIALGGRPGPAVADGAGRLLVSVGEAGEILLLDARRLTVLRRWPVPNPGPAVALALDAARNRLFVLQSGHLDLFDSLSGKALASLALAEPGAGVTCDPATGLAYVYGEAGGLFPVSVGDNGLRLGARVSTRPGACAMALDRGTHRLYLSYPVPEAALGFRVQVVEPAAPAAGL